MNIIMILWAILSMIPGAGYLVAALSLWSVRRQPGSLVPFVFCVLNGMYDIAFGIILLLALSLGDGAPNNLFLLLWVILYIPARVSGIALALLLSGQIDDGWIRRALRVVDENKE